jgi:hypothetical protein
MKVARAIKGMKKLVTQTRAGNYSLTDEGKETLKSEK